MRQLRNILFGLIIFVLGFILFKYLNTNGRIIPYKISKTIEHPDKKDYQILDFKKFKLTLPIGWKDKGFIIGEEGEIRGELKKDGKIFVYEYGISAVPPTQTLQEYLYEARNNNIIMGNEIIVNETDSTREVTYVYPISSETSDTLKTGLLTDSILKIYPKTKVPKVLLGNPNYYSLTTYNNSIYFIPIEVPDEIVNSQITNIDSFGYKYNILIPKNRETGYTKITVNKGGFSAFALWGEKLDSIDQRILIEASLSVRFNNDYRFD